MRGLTSAFDPADLRIGELADSTPAYHRGRLLQGTCSRWLIKKQLIQAINQLAFLQERARAVLERDIRRNGKNMDVENMMKLVNVLTS